MKMNHHFLLSLFLFLNLVPLHLLKANPIQLTYYEAIDHILEQSPDVIASRALLESVRFGNLSNKLTLLPSLNAKASQNYSQTSHSSVIDRTYSITADFNLFKFGGDIAKMQVARHSTAAQEQEYLNSLLAIEEEASDALFSHLRSLLLLDLYKDDVKLRQESFNIAKLRYKKGFLALQEVQKIEIDLESSKVRLVNAEIEHSNSKEELKRLLGHQNVALKWPFKKRLLAHSSPTELLKTLESHSLSRHPKWKAAQSVINSTNAEVKEALSSMAPSFDLSFTYGYSNSIKPESTGYSYWTGTLTLSFPLFDRLVRYGNYKSKVKNRIQQEASFEKIKRATQKNWATSRTIFIGALNNARAQEKILETVRSLYRDNLKRFKLGRINANDLAQEESRRISTEIQSIESWKSTHSSLVQLCHAAGKPVRQCLLSESGDPFY